MGDPHKYPADLNNKVNIIQRSCDHRDAGTSVTEFNIINIVWVVIDRVIIFLETNLREKLSREL